MRAVSLAGVLALGYSIFHLYREPVRPDWMMLLILLVLVSSRVDVHLPGAGGKMTLTDTFIYIGVVILNPWAATVIGSINGLATCLRNVRHMLTVGINMAAMNLAVLGAALLTERMFGPLDHLVYQEGRLDEFIIALGVLALFIYLINTGIIATALSLQRNRNIFRLWVDNYLWTSVAFFYGMAAAGVICKAITFFGFYSLFISVPMLLFTYVTYQTYLKRVEASNRHIEKLTRLHLATIESLTMAIDAKDEMTRGHIQRVRVLAEGLGRAVGYPEEQMEGLKAGALLHDIGKLAVPEHILNKRGKLSPAEYAKIMVHPVVGADILSNVEFPYEVVPIVKHHHEKYDGTGYPSGLAGENIPLGARILTVVDCYDALTTTRPYRPHYSREQALELMRREAGRTFDPSMLGKFLEIVESLEDRLPVTTRAVSIQEVEQAHTGQILEYGAGAAPKTRSEKALRDISSAQREVLSLYEISQTLGATLKLSDVLPLIGSKLENIANFTTLVIYLAEDDCLRAAYTLGRNADILKNAAVPLGNVAGHREAMIGGGPPIGLEVVLGHGAAAYRSTAVFPLIREDDLVGALALYSEQDCGYSADEVRLLETIANHAAAAVHNALVFERTQESAVTDNLTGLPNSRYMYSFFDQERSRAERHGYNMVLMMMDLDGFKKINDTYGHHIGDEILRRIAHLARAQLRTGDVLIRYAGDEFVAVLHRATPEIVLDLKERLQSAVDDFSHEVRPGRAARVGISIGHAMFGEDGTEIDELMEIADQRMYEDKLARRRGLSTVRLAAS
ncbi:MAG TPA: diguanylate cyclase [Blastocatellia bacterium]|nr:diguanylate cyclase [Blastocatellia bacterium]